MSSDNNKACLVLMGSYDIIIFLLIYVSYAVNVIINKKVFYCNQCDYSFTEKLE